MASGFEDWKFSVNIFTQQLSEVTTRPKYGTPKKLSYSDILTSSEYKSLGSDSGKGIIYGGFCSWDSTVLCKNNLLELYVDGEQLLRISPATLFLYNIIQNPYCFFYVIRYDDVNHKFSVGFANGITFETSIEIKAENAASANTNYQLSLIYANLE